MDKALNHEQIQLVKNHLHLVPQMVHALTRCYSHLSREESEELIQTGYLALCNAAVKYNPETPFPPYARAAIRNSIYDYWRDCRKRKVTFCSLEALLTDEDGGAYEPDFPLPGNRNISPEQAILSNAPISYLQELEQKNSTYLQKGIASLRLQQIGYTSDELAKIYGVPSNRVRAWQSKARKLLKQDQELYALLA